MCCKGREEVLALYAGGDLPSSEYLAIDAHVGACQACRAYVGELTAIRATLGGLNESVADDLALDALGARIRSASSPSTRQRTATRWVSVAGGLVACALLAVALTQLRGDRTPASIVPVEEQLPVAVNQETALAAEAVGLEAPPRPTPDRIVAKILTRNPNIVIILLASDDAGEKSDEASTSVL